VINPDINTTEYNEEITMAKREIDPKAIARDEDVLGNNAAFTCPICGKVFLVRAFPPKQSPQGRPCPGCEKSTGHPPTKDERGAYIEWDSSQYSKRR
jgi:predicted RNA-binding Zn-ribbon protein involved in translation (DUF1610 family)